MERRNFLRNFGISTLGIASISAVGAQISQAASTTQEITREEFDALKKKYEDLDGRSKLMIRGMLLLLGLDFLLM
jgi:hypothetical protein